MGALSVPMAAASMFYKLIAFTKYICFVCLLLLVVFLHLSKDIPSCCYLKWLTSQPTCLKKKGYKIAVAIVAGT